MLSVEGFPQFWLSLSHPLHPLPPEDIEPRCDDQGGSGPEAPGGCEIAPYDIAQQGGPDEGAVAEGGYD